MDLPEDSAGIVVDGGCVPDEARRPGRKRDPKCQTAIIDATVELIARDGYDRVTIERIAAHAGVGKATVYRRWDSKAALAVDALRAVKPPMEPIDTGTIDGDLELLAQAYCSAKTEQAGALMLGIASAMSRDAELLDVYEREMAGPRRARVQQIFAQAQERGEVPSDVDVGVLADVLPSMVQQQLLRTGRPPSPDTIRTIMDHVLRPALGLARPVASIVTS